VRVLVLVFALAFLGCTTYTNPLTGTTRTFVDLDKCIDACVVGELGVRGMVCPNVPEEKDRLTCEGGGEAAKGLCKIGCARFAKEAPPG